MRVRLALWALLLLGLAQIGISILIYLAISGWLEDQVNRSLLLTASQVAGILYDPDDPRSSLDIADVRRQLANDDITSLSFLREQGFFVRLVDMVNARVVAASADYAIPAPHGQMSQPTFETVNVHQANGTSESRLYTLPLDYAPGLALQVGVSLRDVREIQGDMARVLGVLLLFTAVSTPLSGWFLANRALTPVRAAVATAAEINASDLSQRLDIGAAEVELEQLVRTFNAMLERIEQAFRRQRQFTADAAHELRTPLSIMLTGLEVTLSRERSAAEYQTTLASVQEEVQRLAHLANSLLMLARADTRDVPLEMHDVDLWALLDTVIDQLAARANEKSISVTREIAPDLIVRGDEARLIQVVYNLLDNALKYTPAGGSVRVTAARHADHIEFAVQDSGPGIPAAEHPHIFERFYRADAARSRGHGGFGLGLAIAKQGIELHGGTITVISEAGQGARFVVNLPARV